MSDIFYKDIFFCKADALVNPVNCKGVMGKGLAREFRKRFTANYLAYTQACRDFEIMVGKCFIFDGYAAQGLYPKYIINFPTKNDWRNPSTLDMIRAGLADMMAQIIAINKDPKKIPVKTLAIPALGCGEGGLRWHDVKPLIELSAELIRDTVDVHIFGPITNEKFTDA